MAKKDNKVGLRFVSKSERTAGRLRDALRIICWEVYRLDNKLSKDEAFQAYAEFQEQWASHEIHQMDYAAVMEFATNLEYSEEYLLQYRNRYYEKKSRMSQGKAYQAEWSEPVEQNESEAIAAAMNEDIPY